MVKSNDIIVAVVSCNEKRCDCCDCELKDRIHNCSHWSCKGLCKEEKFQKSEIRPTIGSEWVCPGLTRNFVVVVENLPKLALNHC